MPAGIFPQTSVTALGAARSDDPAERARAWQRIAEVYRRPVYVHLRVKWRKSPHEAEDLTQHFFLHAVERDLLARYEPSKGRFRTYVRICADRMVMNLHEGHQALKRGGGARPIDADFSELETSIGQGDPVDPDRVFEEEWARSVLAASVTRLAEELAAEDRAHLFDAFSRYDLSEEKVSYGQVAEAMGVSVSDVTNYLHAARKRFRSVALDVLRDLTANDEEFKAEARELFGAEVG